MAKKQWTYNQRKTLLARALEMAMPNNDPTNNPVTPWIRDLSDTEVIYSATNRTFRRGYTIGDDGAVELTESEEVIEQVDYTPIKVSSFSFEEVIEFGRSMVKMKGLVFRLGKYPDKNFEMDEKQWDENAQKNFTPQPIDIEHATKPDGTFLTQILGHDCGNLVKVSRKGRDCFGEIEIPKWLHELAGGQVGVSLAFAKDKRIVGCALTLRPRVAGAAVAAAFAGGDVIDCMTPEQNDQGLFAKVGVAVAAALAAIGIGDKPEVKTLQPTPTPAATPAPTTLSDSERAELERLRADQKAFSEREVKTFAAAEARRLITEGKIVPAQEAHVTSMFEQALRDDNEGGVFFGSDGKPNVGERVKTLKEMFAGQPKHGLITKPDGLAAKDATTLSGKEAEDDQRNRIKEALAKGLSG